MVPAALLLCALFVAFAAARGSGGSLASKGRREQAPDTDPFALLAKHYLRAALLKDSGDKAAGHKSGAASLCSEAAIEKALTKLAAAQGALKSLDGLTHQFRNTLKDSSSLNARFSKFCRGEKKNLKEATKLYEYINVVERSLQCVEVLSAVQTEDASQREQALADAGLVEVRRVPIEHNKLQCTLSLLRPRAEGDSESARDGRFDQGEVVMAIVYSLEPPASFKQALRVMSQDTDSAELVSVGLVKEEVTIQPTLLQLGAKVLSSVKDLLLPEDAAARPRSVRVLGHSIGGAVAAYAALVLDGSLNLTHPSLADSKSLFGLYRLMDT